MGYISISLKIKATIRHIIPISGNTASVWSKPILISKICRVSPIVHRQIPTHKNKYLIV